MIKMIGEILITKKEFQMKKLLILIILINLNCYKNLFAIEKII